MEVTLLPRSLLACSSVMILRTTTSIIHKAKNIRKIAKLEPWWWNWKELGIGPGGGHADTPWVNRVRYKDAPELSGPVLRRSSSTSTYEADMALEKDLLVNPCCPVRIMLEYIRKKCRLGVYTEFDLCDDSGVLMGLFHMASYAYATDRFEHKKTYYLIVLKETENKRVSILPQLNRENQLYLELKLKIKAHMSGSPQKGTPAGTVSAVSKVGPRSPPLGNAKTKRK